ncbi:MAG: 1-deoxy-D-xylulose-5-phosphate synthase [Actinomycetaceae bacterium]|nr:1-deoxy-D-xylulose-5-phosphate synthase [Actinomycetaceae bacterium]
MTTLDNISGPADLRGLTGDELKSLSAEIRQFLVETVSRTGGHLGPNLGVVELTIALHRSFDSPNDVLIFDTGHQAYVHKILTGRHNFTQLRQEDGLSGYPSRDESEHDVVENSHASTALSWADGVARTIQLSGKPNHVVAVVGDGAMTGGMVWEALNNIAQDPDRPIVIVLNDNGRSYAPTVGGIVRRFDAVRKMDSMRVDRRYEQFLAWGKDMLTSSGIPGQMAYDALHGFKRGVKEIFVDAGIFDYLGMKYIGPVDGHDIVQMEEAFKMAREYGGPVVVHCITEKGRGYKPAEDNKDDHFHAVGKIHPETGLPIEPAKFGWTSVFAEEIVKLADENPKIIGVTAAMLEPVGLGPLSKKYPKRVIDVGIAEQHALTMAAGLAHGGYHPVVALYATFMNRAFDQLLMDIALHREAVTICLDRAGVTGDDGPSHNGMWDLSLAAMIPGLQVAAPRDEIRMRELLREAVAIDGPTLMRYSKGSLPPRLDPIRQIGSLDVLYENTKGSGAPIVLFGVGPMAHTVLAAARELPEINTIVVDPRWVLPISADLIDLCASARGVVVLEDGLVDGGIGSELEIAMHRQGACVPVQTLGIRREFIAHASRQAVLEHEEMTTLDVIAAIKRIA